MSVCLISLKLKEIEAKTLFIAKRKLAKVLSAVDKPT
jgi:hypothetical protein